MNNFTCRKEGLYEYNVGILKKYTSDEFKLIKMRAVRIAGYEERTPIAGKKNTAGNTVKLRESLSRSQSKVYELALCNPWAHFATLTLNQNKQNRYNLDEAMRHLTKWINNLNYRQNIDIKYLLVPEPHKDNAWHFHGLFMGIPPNLLTPFSISDNISLKIKKLLQEGHEILDFPLYREKFGWVTVEPIRDKERAAKYVTKYITKELMESKIALNHHVFYASQGLMRSETIYRAQLRQEFEPDFKNDYVSIKHFGTLEEPLQYFCDKEDSYG